MATNGLFKPQRPDGRADWRVVYDLLMKLEPGDQIDHETLLNALGSGDRSRLYRAVARADRELWLSSRAVANVKNVGYRILHANEHEPRANNHRRQARRQVSNAVGVMNAVDMAVLTDSERDWTTKVQIGLQLLATAMDSHEQRLQEHDSVLAHLITRVDDLEQRNTPRELES